MKEIKNDNELAKNLQKAQLKIFRELDRVCKELNLEYCLAFGTALGAVRHKGFIPWDDDIDVYMRIEDLETLQRNADRFSEGFFLQYRQSDPEFGLMITRLRDSNTTLIEKTETERDINHGIFVDIYPLFNSPKDGWPAKKLVIDSMLYRLLLYGVVPQNRGLVMKLGSTVLLKMISKHGRERLIQKYYQKMKATPYTGYLSSLYGDEQDIRYPESSFFPVQWVPFEDIQVPVEADIDQYLRMTYGDYMTLPPEDKRQFHHDYACVDFDKPYTFYRGIKYCINRLNFVKDRTSMDTYRYDNQVLAKLQTTELEMLKTLDRICRNHNIPYFLSWGSMLGAVRHNGFIPWDDDIDVGMLREDYEKLRLVPESEWGEKIELVDPEDMNPVHRLPYPQIFLRNTVYETKYHWTYDIVKNNPEQKRMPIWLDIFVFDHIRDKKTCYQIGKKVFFLSKLLYWSKCRIKRNKEDTIIQQIACMGKATLFWLLNVVKQPEIKIYHRLLKLCKKYPGDYVTDYFLPKKGNPIICSYDQMFPLKMVRFEDVETFIPRNADELLTATYGDYMKMPPEKDRYNHPPYTLDFGDGQGNVCER